MPIIEYLGEKSGDVRDRKAYRKNIRLIKDIYTDVKTQVNSSVGTTDEFDIKVGLH